MILRGFWNIWSFLLMIFSPTTFPLSATVVSCHAKHGQGSSHHRSQKGVWALNKTADLTHLHHSPLAQSGALQTQEPSRHTPKASTTTPQATLVPETMLHHIVWWDWEGKWESGNLLQMQILGPHARPTESKLGGGPSHLCYHQHFGVGEDSWESLALQGDPTSPSSRKSVLNVHWKDWCWSWNSNTLATWYEELTPLKRSWCWERLKVGREGDDRGWDGWVASLTQWTWVWISSGNWWWTWRPGVLQSMGSKRVGYNWAVELTEISGWTFGGGDKIILIPQTKYKLQMNLSLCDPLDCSWQAPLSMEFSSQEYWCGLPFPFPEDLPHPAIKPTCPALQMDSLPLSHLGIPIY